MADENHRELIEQFNVVTGAPEERCKFYLESAAWNLNVALSHFYDEGGQGVDVDEAPAQGPSVVNLAESSDDDDRVVDIPPEASKGKASSDASRPRPKIASLSSFKRDDTGSSSEEEGQTFYAGGSEHSGQQVLGPPRKKPSADKLVDNMFKAAKEHGAETVEGETSRRGAGPRPTFRGAGYRLGEHADEPLNQVAGSPFQEEQKQTDAILKLWKNGFSVDDGPLRDYHDPANKDFLQSIHRGEIPRELLRLSKGAEVNLNMEDHRTEDFVAPKRSVKAFSGEGFKLGSPAPSVVESASGAAAAVGAAGSVEQSAESAQTAVSVDNSQPTTSLQIRLADGSRLVAKFNHTHTVGDIRTYIRTARPQSASGSFMLMTTFPNKQLTEDSQTLADANLLNAVVVQRLQ